MLNHLIGSQQINVVKLKDHLDYPSGNNHSIFKMIHIHVFHGNEMFSKNAFKMGKYDNMTSRISDFESDKYVSLFALKMALEGKFLKGELLMQLLYYAVLDKA